MYGKEDIVDDYNGSFELVVVFQAIDQDFQNNNKAKIYQEPDVHWVLTSVARWLLKRKFLTIEPNVGRPYT